MGVAEGGRESTKRESCVHEADGEDSLPLLRGRGLLTKGLLALVP